MISTFNAIAYGIGVTDEENAYSCNSIGAKTGLAFGAAEGAAEVESDVDSVFSDGEEFQEAGDAFFGNYDSEGDDDSESLDAPAGPKAKAEVPPPAVVHQEGDVALAASINELRSHDKYSKELMFHEKVMCAICGKERVALQAFDTHVCDSASKAALKAAQEERSGRTMSSYLTSTSGSSTSGSSTGSSKDVAAPKLQQSQMWEAAVKSVANNKAPAAFAAGGLLEDINQHLIQSSGADRKQAAVAAIHAKFGAEQAASDDVKVKSTPLKVADSLDEKAFINAVVNAEDIKMSFRGANGAVVLVSGKLSMKQKAYNVKMGIASSTSTEASTKKMHKVIKFTQASDTDTTLSHKLIGSGVSALREQHSQETVAPNVETVLNVAKKISAKPETA